MSETESHCLDIHVTAWPDDIINNFTFYELLHWEFKDWSTIFNFHKVIPITDGAWMLYSARVHPSVHWPRYNMLKKYC